MAFSLSPSLPTWERGRGPGGRVTSSRASANNKGPPTLGGPISSRTRAGYLADSMGDRLRGSPRGGIDMSMACARNMLVSSFLALEERGSSRAKQKGSLGRLHLPKPHHPVRPSNYALRRTIQSSALAAALAPRLARRPARKRRATRERLRAKLRARARLAGAWLFLLRHTILLTAAPSH